MKEITKTYEPAHLESIKRMLMNEANSGSPRYYEIWVDALKVVDRTNDPGLFNKHEEFIYSTTETVTVNLFTTSPTSAHIISRYNFTFGDEPKSKDESFRGFGLGEVEARINEKVTQERERWECDQVRKDLETTKTKLKEAEDWNEKLEGIIDETKKKLEEAKSQSDFAGILKDLALSQLIKKPEEKQALSGSDKPKEEASFKMKSSEENALSEDDKFFLEFGRDMKATFSKDEFDMVFSIISEFVKDKTNIKPVMELLNINQHKTEQQNGKV